MDILFFDNFWVFVFVTFISLTTEAVHVINFSIMQKEVMSGISEKMRSRESVKFVFGEEKNTEPSLLKSQELGVRSKKAKKQLQTQNLEEGWEVEVSE